MVGKGGDVLDRFSPATRAWFAAPSPRRPGPGRGVGRRSAAGEHALVVAPTGSGKTLAAFLWALDRLAADAAAGGAEAALPGALRLAAEGAGGRRRAQPARAAGRHPAGGRPARPARARDQRSASAPATPRRRSGGPSPRPPGHPDHHPGVAVPDADLRGARDAARRRDGDRRRGARGGGHQARRAPGADPRAAGRAARAAGAADRAVGDGPAARRGGAVPGRRAAGRRSSQPPSTRSWTSQVVVPVEDMAELGTRPATSTGPAAGASGAPRSGRTSRSGSST